MDALLTGQDPAASTDPSDALVSFLANRNTASLAGEAPSAADAPASSSDIFADFADSELTTLQSKFGNLSFDITLGDLDLETALSDPSPRATGRLFVLGQAGEAAALDAFINRAVRAGVDEKIALDKLAPMIQALPAQSRVNTNLSRYTAAAVMNQDIAGLQQIYSALPQGPAQARIALITDALGGGFFGQALGRDIEGRLADPAARGQAVKDTQIALALGASLSDPAAEVLSIYPVPALTLPQNQLLLLEAAMRDDSRAETSLIVASPLSSGSLNVTDKAYLISALTKTGLQRFAGRLAADVYFEGLKTTL